MSNPIIIAHHLIWTAYGWWLGNDPRGSMSKSIDAPIIKELGELHYGRKQLQPAGRVIREFYERAAQVLKYELLTFGGTDVAAIAESFGQVIEREKYTCYACAIMPDHVHMIIRKHKHQAEEMIEKFQGSSRLRLRSVGLRTADHLVWGGPGWKVFLDHPSEVRKTIRYVEQNPEKIGRAVQHWPFVKAYDDWPLHPGHSPNSPYVKALKTAGRYPHDR